MWAKKGQKQTNHYHCMAWIWARKLQHIIQDCTARNETFSTTQAQGVLFAKVELKWKNAKRLLHDQFQSVKETCSIIVDIYRTECLGDGNDLDSSFSCSAISCFNSKWFTLSCWRFLCTCSLGVSTIYDLGEFAGATIHPAIVWLSIPVHTSVSSGFGGEGRGLCRWSWSSSCFCLLITPYLAWRQKSSMTGLFGLSSSLSNGRFALRRRPMRSSDGVAHHGRGVAG